MCEFGYGMIDVGHSRMQGGPYAEQEEGDREGEPSWNFVS